MVNKELHRHTRANPLPAKFEFIGELKAVNKLLGDKTSKRTVEGVFMQIKARQDIVDGAAHGNVRAYFSINAKNAGTMERINDYMARLDKAGVILNPKAEELIAHEYGHLVDQLNPVTRWTSIADDLYDEYKALKYGDYGGLDTFIRNNVGNYMLANKSEFFAEAYRLYTYDAVPKQLEFIDEFFKAKGFKRIK